MCWKCKGVTVDGRKVRPGHANIARTGSGLVSGSEILRCAWCGARGGATAANLSLLDHSDLILLRDRLATLENDTSNKQVADSILEVSSQLHDLADAVRSKSDDASPLPTLLTLVEILLAGGSLAVGIMGLLQQAKSTEVPQPQQSPSPHAPTDPSPSTASPPSTPRVTPKRVAPPRVRELKEMARLAASRYQRSVRRYGADTRRALPALQAMARAYTALANGARQEWPIEYLELASCA